MTPVEARKTSLGLQPTISATMPAETFVVSRPRLPVKALALPELTSERPRLAGFQRRLAPVDRRRRAFRPGEDAGDRRALVEDGKQHVAPVLVLDAGLGGGKTDARDRRQRWKGCRRERGYRCHCVPSLLSGRLRRSGSGGR